MHGGGADRLRRTVTPCPGPATCRPRRRRVFDGGVRLGGEAMTVRRTEHRLPAGFHAADLGQACVAAGGGLDEGYALVSSLTSPLPIASTIDYVVFVATGEDIVSYDWRFERVSSGIAQTATTDIGVNSYMPLALDLLQVS